MATLAATSFFAEAFDWFAKLSSKLPQIDFKTFFIVVVAILIGVGLIVALTYLGTYRFKLTVACKKIIRYLGGVEFIDDDNVSDFTTQCFSQKAPSVLRDCWVQYLGVRFGYPSDIVSEQNVYDKEVKRVREFRANAYITVALILIAIFSFWGYGTLDGHDMGVIFLASLLLSGAIYLALVIINKTLSKNCLDTLSVMQEDLDAKVILQVEKTYATDSSPLAELSAIVDEIIARNTAKDIGFDNGDVETPIELLIAQSADNKAAGASKDEGAEEVDDYDFFEEDDFFDGVYNGQEQLDEAPQAETVEADKLDGENKAVEDDNSDSEAENAEDETADSNSDEEPVEVVEENTIESEEPADSEQQESEPIDEDKIEDDESVVEEGEQKQTEENSDKEEPAVDADKVDAKDEEDVETTDVAVEPEAEETEPKEENSEDNVEEAVKEVTPEEDKQVEAEVALQNAPEEQPEESVDEDDKEEVEKPSDQEGDNATAVEDTEESTDEPASDESVKDEPVTAESVEEDVTNEEHSEEEPLADVPVADESAKDKPLSSEDSEDRPAKEEQVDSKPDLEEADKEVAGDVEATKEIHEGEDSEFDADDEIVKPAKLVKLPNLMDYMFARNPSRRTIMNMATMLLSVYKQFENSDEDKQIIIGCLKKVMTALQNNR